MTPLFNSYNSPTTVPEVVCQNSQIIRDLSRRKSTLKNILLGSSRTTEDDNKALPEDLEKVRSENNILLARSKALEEEGDSLLTALRIINAESFINQDSD